MNNDYAWYYLFLKSSGIVAGRQGQLIPPPKKKFSLSENYTSFYIQVGSLFCHIGDDGTFLCTCTCLQLQSNVQKLHLFYNFITTINI